jgi:hypothetical protein
VGEEISRRLPHDEGLKATASELEQYTRMGHVPSPRKLRWVPLRAQGSYRGVYR